MVKLLHLVCGIVPAKQCTASGHMVKHFQWALGKVGESTGSSKSCIIRCTERNAQPVLLPQSFVTQFW